MSGDSAGRLHVWSAAPQWHHDRQVQLLNGEQRFSVVCIESLCAIRQGVVAVSVRAVPPEVALHISAHNGVEVSADVGAHCGVVLVDLISSSVLSLLAGHKDVVRCMCSTPDGRLATAGGKMDASVVVWDRAQWEDNQEDVASEQGAAGESGQSRGALYNPAQRLQDPGFVNALIVVPDKKPGSSLFALAGARYNAVRICL